MVISSTTNTMTLTLKCLLVALTLTFGAVQCSALPLDNVEKVDNKEELLHRVRRQVDDSCDVADIIFVLDSSGSIGLENWDRQLNFTISIVSAFLIGPENVQIGVNYYGNNAILAFNLNTFENEVDVVDAIALIPWLDQNTNTSGGIRLMHRDMFTGANGARNNAPRIAIVITDGTSTFDKEMTIPEADNARNKNIVMFAIGIGAAISQDELEGIANKPGADEQFVFNAESFEALGAIREAVVTTTCSVASDCTATGDIVVILDSSGSVGPVHFNSMRDFTRNMILQAAIDEGETRIGVMTYGNSADVKWHLDDYSTRAEMINALDNTVTYTAGTTNTADALNRARNNMFTALNGDRAGFNNVIILFTDGGSDDFSNTLSEARMTRLAGIKIFVVAVTGWVNTIEINEITSDPDLKNAFFVPEFSDLMSIFQPLKRAVCDDADECNGVFCQNGGSCINDVSRYLCICPAGWAGQHCDIRCPHPANVIIVLDSSMSIGRMPYYTIQDYAKHLIENFNMEARNNGQTVGLITFSGQAIIRINLSQYSTKSEMIDAISYPFMGSTTNSGEAIRMVVDQAFNSGGTQNARRIAIIVTDGQSSNRAAAFVQAARAHSAEINVLALGVDVKGRFARQELMSFASDPDEMNYMEVSEADTAQLVALTNQIVRTVCNDIDECASGPCQGGGSCVDQLNGYECRCPNGRSGINCERGCDGELDVVFLIDSSGSIHEDRYAIELEFINNVTTLMEVRPGRTHIGAISFSDNAVIELPIGQYRQKEDVLSAIRTIMYRRGRTNTADGLRMMYEQLFTQGNGDRDNVPNIGFLITDGLSTVNRDQTIPQAIRARIAGVHVIVASVENDPNNLELKGVANRPAANNIFNVNRFAEMPSMVDALSMALCNDVDECSSNPCQAGSCINGLHSYRCNCPNDRTGQNCQRTCTRQLDVALLLDASGSMQDFEFTQDIARYIAIGLNYNNNRVRVGVITYQDQPTTRFLLNEYFTQLEVMNGLNFNNDRNIHGTNTASAINSMRNGMFSTVNGDRFGIDNVAVLFSDGRSNQGQGDLTRETLFAKQAGIRFISVGVGNNVNTPELEDIASNPSSDNLFTISEVEEIVSVGDRILDQLCV